MNIMNIMKNEISIRNELNTIQLPSFIIRICSFFIDLTFVYLSIFLFLEIGLGINYSFIFQPWGWGRLLTVYTFFIYYFSFLFFMNGQTLGAKLFRFKVVTLPNKKINFYSSFFRAVFITLLSFPIVLGQLSIYLASIFLLVSIISLSSENIRSKKQTFWDIGSKTIVIKIDNSSAN